VETWGLLVVALVIAVGLVGVVVPLLPGLLLVWGAVAVWAFVEGGVAAYVLLGVATALALTAQVVKYLVPGRRLQRAGVPNRSLLLGGLLGVVGFFVVPVIGLLLGFVLGIYLAERARLRAHSTAWTSTRHALTAVGLSVLLELATALLIAIGWAGTIGLA
jgi:uncharacterized protein YqgC (DUF456 family)